ASSLIHAHCVPINCPNGLPTSATTLIPRSVANRKVSTPGYSDSTLFRLWLKLNTVLHSKPDSDRTGVALNINSKPLLLISPALIRLRTNRLEGEIGTSRI